MGMDGHITHAVAAERMAGQRQKAADRRLAAQAAQHSGTQDQTRPARPGRGAALALTRGFHWLATRRLVSEHRQTRPLAD